MRPATNTEAAAWIPKRLHPFARDVGSVIPEGFAAYARIFHPFGRWGPDGTIVPVRWKDIAAANNRTIAEELQRVDISTEPSRLSSSGDELWSQQIRSGSLPHDIAVRLAATLSACTQTPKQCWFAVWEGHGDLPIRMDSMPMFAVPERKFFLHQGAVNDVLTTMSDVDWSYLSPNLWWPDDRAWCVATEIDFNWSYVGGSVACIEQILADPELEAIPTTPEQGNCMEK